MRTLKCSKSTLNILFWLFMAIGIGARVWKFGVVPADINVDEAYAGYEAYSLLHYGMDSHGYRFPVYLTTWGSGMSALNSYLMIPFLAFFGAQTWVIRMPQLIVGCLTLWVVFLIVKRVINEYAALYALFFLAISPWHIMMCRWGMDANLAPGFIVFGLYFFLRGMENARYFILAALFYGLSLYCYATIWPFVPLMLVLQLGYGSCYKRICFSWELLVSGMILFFMALPLLLFLLVNFGVIEEICLPFISIPRLLHMRANEFSFSNLYEQIKNLWHIVKLQYDWLPHNGTEGFGIFYHCSFPFFVIGSFVYLKELVIGIVRKKYCPHMMILIQLGAAVLLGVSIQANINRVNILFIPIIIITASGIYYVCMLGGRLIGVACSKLRWKKENGIFETVSSGQLRKWLLIVSVGCYLVLFVKFERYYFTEYRTEIEYHFCKGIEEAVDHALQYDGTIYVSPGIQHPRILFYSEVDVTEYIETVKYYNYPSSFLETVSFGRFNFEFDSTKPDKDAVYILSKAVDLSVYEEMGFILDTFDWFTVAHMDER